MKDNINEKLNKLYPEVPESFHNKVTETLEGLDEHKDIPIRKHNRGLKIAVACAAITVVGAFTVAAAAINFFGLFSEKVGNYGLHVGVEQSTEESSANEVKSDPDKSEKHYKIVASYVPEGFKNEVDNPLVCHYHYGDKVFENRDLDYHIRASKEQYYDETYDNVIKSENDKVNGRDVVYMTFQYGENEEKLIYGAVVYFKDEGYIVYVNNSDLNELKKIVAGLSLEEDTEYEEHRANNETSDNQNNKFDYSGTDFDSKLVKVEGNTLTTKDEEKEALEEQLAIEENKRICLSEAQILAFLDFVCEMPLEDVNKRRAIINILVHSVYLYDDHFTLIFNASKKPMSIDNIPLEEIEEAFNSDKTYNKQCSTMTSPAPPITNESCR